MRPGEGGPAKTPREAPPARRPFHRGFSIGRHAARDATKGESPIMTLRRPGAEAPAVTPSSPRRRRGRLIPRPRLLLGVLGALPALLLAPLPQHEASAATSTSNMTVTATVQDNCTVSATALAFGGYNSASNRDGTATITVNCSTGTLYTVALDLGLGTGSTLAARRMTGPQAGDLLGYQLYSDASRSVLWGLTAGVNTVAGTGSGVDQPLTVYGRIVAGQTVRAGAYTDTIGITVTY